MILEGFFRHILIPSNLISILFLVAIILTLLGYRNKKIKLMFLTGLCIFLFFGFGPVSYWLMRGLEYQYPAVADQIHQENINQIVLLAGYAENKLYLPVSSRINQASAYRILEAVKIYRANPDNRKIIISGHENVPELIKSVLISIGIPDESILLDEVSSSTVSSARNLFPLLAEKPFFLVTSAGHMPRAVDAFRKYQMLPVPAPTHFLSSQNIFEPAYLPTQGHLYISDLAILEYIATLHDAID